MKNLFYWIVCGIIFLVLTISNANAAWFGDYVSAHRSGNSFALDEPQQNQIPTTSFCTDKTNRRVPGVVENGYCNVEWKGKAYRNSNFYVLLTPPDGVEYRQTPLTNENIEMAINRGITNGGFDEGYYTSHCIISFSGGYSTYGKFIPNRRGCYYSMPGNAGAVGFKGMSDSSVDLFVLTAYIP